MIENIYNTSLRAVFITASFFILLSCSGNEKWVEKIEEGDFSFVTKGRAPYASRKIESPSDYDNLISNIRGDIEGNPEMMEKIMAYFSVDIPENLTFQYDFSSLDEKREKVILRYFAVLPDSEIFAGVALQFVVDVKAHKVLKIYTIQVLFE
ncbi:hypothetical protein IIA15_10415 [candidate division TA06 bacterium]|nr:hypothetical protein [candidate division TA06 bacterium]